MTKKTDIITTPLAQRRLEQLYSDAIITILAPRPVMAVSEWADTFRYISVAENSEPGKWNTARAPYQKGMMDAVSDSNIETVVLMCASRVGKSEVINNAVGYFACLDPGPMLVVQPNQNKASEWSKLTLTPTVQTTPALRAIFPTPKTRDSNNEILRKRFLGGVITAVGANSPSDLSALSVRYLFLDEVDRFPASAGTEGDPVTLALRRTTNFWNRKVVMASSPQVKELSRIEKAYDGSDRRKYFVPCPHCQTMQDLKWNNLKWQNDDPSTAQFLCINCNTLIDELHKPQMLAKGEWRRTTNTFDPKIAGFHISALYSPWVSWSELVNEWLKLGGNKETFKADRELLKAFVNTRLGETFQEIGEKLQAHELAGRCIPYDAIVPTGVGYLTGACDVQKDRLEYLIWGWGAREESWYIWHEVLSGDVMREDVWNNLTAALEKTYSDARGVQLACRVFAIDSGHFTDQVWTWANRFVRTHRLPRILVIKGEDGRHRDVIQRPNKGDRKPWLVGVDVIKDELYNRWDIPEGPRAIWLPDTVSPALLEQFTAEEKRYKMKKGGVPELYWHKKGRNEGLDMLVYSFAALRAQGTGITDRLDRFVKVVQAGTPNAQPVVQPPPQQPRPRTVPGYNPQQRLDNLLRRQIQNPWVKRFP